MSRHDHGRLQDSFKTIKGETVETNLNALTAVIESIRPSEDPTRHRHHQFHNFKVSSSTSGLVSTQGDVYDTIDNGLDVQGEINGEEATGKGQILTGNDGNSSTEGLAIRYTGQALPGEPNPPDLPQPETAADQVTQANLGNLVPVKAGTISLSQNSLVFQIGSNCEQQPDIPTCRPTHWVQRK